MEINFTLFRVVPEGCARRGRKRGWGWEGRGGSETLFHKCRKRVPEVANLNLDNKVCPHGAKGRQGPASKLLH